MNLFTHPKKKPTGQIGQPASKADSLLPPEPLAALHQLIAPMRERMKRYDEAIQALAVTRDRLLDLEDLPPPDMTFTVERELLAARGDAEALRAFDAEHGDSLAAEREQRMALSREREELLSLAPKGEGPKKRRRRKPVARKSGAGAAVGSGD